MPNSNLLTSPDSETRTIFLEWLFESKQREIYVLKNLNRCLVKMILQSDSDVEGQLERGLKNFDEKLKRLEEILESKVSHLEERIEFSSDRFELKLTDLKKQIAMLGLAVVKSHKELDVPVSLNADPSLEINEPRDCLDADQSSSTSLAEQRNLGTAKIPLFKHTNLLWLLTQMIKTLLGCAMVIFTVSVVFCSKTSGTNIYESSMPMDSFASQTITFLRSEFLSWLFHPIA